ncbi:hypothetical protein OAC89_03750 [Deltaproteobacteria bacterium]|nr:hypothetical protein [Deltaproteobacteria bacterium]
MAGYFEYIMNVLIQPQKERSSFSIFDPSDHFDTELNDDAGIARALNAAFIISLTRGAHHESQGAMQFLYRMAGLPRWSELAGFYLKGIDLIKDEVEDVCARDKIFEHRLKTLYDWMCNSYYTGNIEETREHIWSVFFPEGTGILRNRKERIDSLRAKRTVTITELNNTRIQDPARQILFSSNVLLTIPHISKSLDELSISNEIKEKLVDISGEEQIYWYDHPIQIAVAQEKNEILYGLKGLQETFQFECRRGNTQEDEKLVCLLSVSVTHGGLHGIAKKYLEEEISSTEGLTNIDLYIFTEIDTRRIIEEIISPAAEHYLKCDDSMEILGMFGVDGEYGRHYSFLKAVSAFWSVLVDPEIKATFKIDLDQVFPQKELVEQTGSSAFEHMKTALWGAKGFDLDGQPLELGLIAGGLVNESDIEKSLFTPDVKFPVGPISADEYIFFSILPQALSTEAEILAQYNDGKLDGKRRCIQRVHVTGGTNGILVDSLRRHRPFTPSFIGRAEDQAYILSVYHNQEERLAYVHKDGLVMRHDKEVFAQEAIRRAHISKLLGDYVRLLYFSAYAGALTQDVEKLKESVDPFTGCFISKIPVSLTYLRFGFKALSIFSEGRDDQGIEFLKIGSRRITDALKFITGKEGSLKQQYEKERIGWNLYYDTLSAIEDGLKRDDLFALELQKRAQSIIRQCYIPTG